jgi:hypothetical protein
MGCLRNLSLDPICDDAISSKELLVVPADPI